MHQGATATPSANDDSTACAPHHPISDISITDDDRESTPRQHVVHAAVT